MHDGYHRTTGPSPEGKELDELRAPGCQHDLSRVGGGELGGDQRLGGDRSGRLDCLCRGLYSGFSLLDRSPAQRGDPFSEVGRGAEQAVAFS